DERWRRYENAQLGAKQIVEKQGKQIALQPPKPESEDADVVETGIAQETLRSLAHAITTVPQNFNLNPKVVGLLKKRSKMVEDGSAVDWSMAEALAFGSLLLDGTTVRLSGQDSVRGTFSQRHAGFIDVKTGEEWSPLTQLGDGKASCYIYDSP